MSTLITKICELRKEHNLQQAKLSALVGVRRKTIGNLENGKYNPSLKLAMDIAKVFNKPDEDIFSYINNCGFIDKHNNLQILLFLSKNVIIEFIKAFFRNKTLVVLGTERILNMSKTCAICGRDLGLLSRKLKLIDGYICKSCLDQGAIKMSWNLSNSTSMSIQSLIKKRSNVVMSFSVTRKVLDSLKIDDHHKAFKLKDYYSEEDLFLFSDLVKYELLEDGLPIMYNSVGGDSAQAIKRSNGTTLMDSLGGMLTNLVGIKKKLELHVYFSNVLVDTKIIRFTQGDDHVSKERYTNYLNDARRYASAFDSIIAEISQLQPSGTVLVNNNVSIHNTQINVNDQSITANTAPSWADELLKYKNLLDLGAISEGEFEEQKRVLLGSSYCRNCGSKVDKSHRFCSKCGNAL